MTNAFWADKVKLNNAGWLHARLGQQGLGDKQMLGLAAFLSDLLEPEKGATIWGAVDLSENAIGDQGLAVVLEVLERYSVQLKCLKLYRNQIKDAGGARLGELIRRQEEPLEELHLSHNCLTGRTLVGLCLAIGYNSHNAYPYVGKQGLHIPCWLRLEQNDIANPALCLELIQKEAGVKVCRAENRDECGPGRCVCGSRNDKDAPVAHLFIIHSQKRLNRGPSGPQESDVALREIIRKAGVVAPGPAARVAQVAAPNRAAQVPRAVQPPAWGNAAQVQAAPPAPDPSRVASKPEAAAAAPGPPIASKPAGTTKPAAQATPAAAKANAWGRPDQALAAAGYASGGAVKPSEDSARTSFGDSQSQTNSSAGTPELPPADHGSDQRIHPKQLVAESDSFLCPLCHLVSPSPVITVCSHIFCHGCFHAHVDRTLAPAKRSGVQVKNIVCPHPGCTAELAKKDVSPLDSAPGTPQEGGAVHAILRRMRSNQMVRCRHHKDHYQDTFGQEAKALQDTVTCEYVGDLTSMKKHLREDCPVQRKLRAEAADVEPAATVAEAAPTPQDEEKLGDMYRCVFEFAPQGENQLGLSVGDLLLVYDSKDSGWAAGQRVDADTGEVSGNAGWFPMGYCQAVAAS